MAINKTAGPGSTKRDMPDQSIPTDKTHEGWATVATVQPLASALHERAGAGWTATQISTAARSCDQADHRALRGDTYD
jgi:hypothetical protein